ncbi:hypothetical protein [Caudoviricetes sp.]|nr:hypothetical protein [Caudoviricetes sp.]
MNRVDITVTKLLTPTDEDYEAACSKRFADGTSAWASLKREAERATARRLLRANKERRDEICRKLDSVSGAEFLQLQKEFEHAMAQRDVLMGVAYPEQEVNSA